MRLIQLIDFQVYFILPNWQKQLLRAVKHSIWISFNSTPSNINTYALVIIYFKSSDTKEPAFVEKHAADFELLKGVLNPHSQEGSSEDQKRITQANDTGPASTRDKLSPSSLPTQRK